MRKCPNCDTELKKISDEPVELWKCDYCRIEFCKHMLTARRVNYREYACQDCTGNVEECDCMDCYVFCSHCNSFIMCSCPDLVSLVERTESEFENQRRLVEASPNKEKP